MIGPGELLAGWNLLEKIGKARNWWRGRKVALAETVVTRFVRLFESHGVHRNQIPRFIGHDLTLQDVQDDASLLAKLDEQLLEAVCEKFAVRREWLDGAESQIHPCHGFYSYNPESFAQFIEGLMGANPDARLQGVLIAPEERGDAEALLILQEVIGAVGEKPIYRFHLCHNWRFDYWKSRADLTACVAIAWKHNVHVHGVWLPKKEIERLEEGKELLGWWGEGIWKLRGKRERWYPEDMALKPEDFLRGVDPERDNYGIISGLGLWLKLEQQGFMNTGLPMYEAGDIRRLFEQELSKYQTAINKNYLDFIRG